MEATHLFPHIQLLNLDFLHNKRDILDHFYWLKGIIVFGLVSSELEHQGTNQATAGS